MPFRILSIDGGGIRGVIPALVLAEMERRSGKPIAEMFDLIAGTSTGGILALGLVAANDDGRPAFTAADLVNLYIEDGPEIFSRKVWHRVKSAGGLAEEKYPSNGIDNTLRKRFGERWISRALTDVLITSYDIELREPHFFKSQSARGDKRKDFLFADAARATSAAPTYFEPARITSRAEGLPVSLVDGGVYANNPAACALVEAICDHRANPTEIVMLSLGTGELTRPILHEEAASWGLAKWAQPILNVVFDGVSDTVNYQVENIMRAMGGPGRYLRLQVTLNEGNDDMDDASATNLRVLQLLAKSLINNNSAAIDSILAQVEPPLPRPADPLPEPGK